MTILHFDCFSGISGDMILGALVDAGLPFKDLARGLKAVPAGGYVLRSKKVLRGGLHATKVDVVVREGFRAPLSLQTIQRKIRTSRIPTPVKDRSLEVFERLAQAEGIAHRVSPSKVHFHEVGVVDSLVDVVGSLLGCHLLGIGSVTASAVNLGAGMIETAHGRLPVPGPAVAALARNVPVYGAGPTRELTTPTGMAILTSLAQRYGPLPLMRVTSVGYGAGTNKTDEWPNVLRVFLGETEWVAQASGSGEAESVIQIETNLDDLNPQVYETVMDRLFAAGAVDVTLTPTIMKRGRPGIVLAALALRGQAEAVAAVMLRDTTTLGVRMQELQRVVLPRLMQVVRTKGGAVQVKVADTGAGGVKASPEYQDCKRIAERTGRPVREVMDEALRVFEKRGRKGGLRRPA
ncbi:MAG: nickel pincer cofactor biosynthesis protein LarC [Nitrospira sp.]|nr:nickel pincer cofactor biosynthesis protein LarC [Nitrospira sp.]